MLLANAVDFTNRVQQELARAQRYCLYLSLLIVKLPEDHSKSAEHPRRYRNLLASLNSVLRSSDLVVSAKGDQLAVLLVETPSGGMSVVSERIKGFVRDYLAGESQGNRHERIDVSSAVYPDATTDFGALLQSLSQRHQSVN